MADKKTTTRKSSPRKSSPRKSSPRKSSTVSRTDKAKKFIKQYQKELGLGTGALATAVASALIAKKYNDAYKDARRKNLFEGEGPRYPMPHTKMYYGAREGAKSAGKSAAEKSRAARARVMRLFSRK